MDILSLLGILLGTGAIIGGNFMAGGHIDALLNIPAFLIVLGGTLGATMLQFPPRIFFRSLKMVVWIFKPSELLLENQIQKIVAWSILARREGLLGLEIELEEEDDRFSQKGLQLLVDGSEPDIIRDSLEVDIITQEQACLQAARLYEAMGGYSPTIGIIGAVIGLIHVMQNLTDPGLLGSGIATAFVATIYGVAFANLIFLPIASKLKMHIHARTHYREMITDGIIAISEGESPQNIQLKLQGYLLEK